MKGTKRQLVERIIKNMESPFTSRAVLQRIKEDYQQSKVIPTRNEIRGLLISIEGLKSYKEGKDTMYVWGDA